MPPLRGTGGHAGLCMVETRKGGQLCTEGIRPTRGIVAGDAMAMSIVAAYVCEGLKEVSKADPGRVRLSIYVDDVQLQVNTNTRNIVAATVGATQAVKQRLTGELELLINVAKTAVVCSGRPEAVAIAEATGAGKKPRAMFWERNLGVDCAPGRQRKWIQSGSMLTTRHRVAANRMARMMALRRTAGRRTNMLFRTGIKAALCHGSCVVGRSPTEMKRLEQIALRSVGPHTRGASRCAKLVYHQHLVDDQMYTALARLSKEVWRARARQARALPIGGANDGLTGAWRLVVDNTTTWKTATGPIDVAAIELRRLGWQARENFSISKGDITLILTRDSPALVTWWMQRSAHELRMRTMTDKLTNCATPLLGFAAIPGPKSALEHRPFAMSFSTNGLWTMDRLMRVGYLVSPRCALCGADSDDAEHRIWECPAVHEKRRVWADVCALRQRLLGHGDQMVASSARIAGSRAATPYPRGITAEQEHAVRIVAGVSTAWDCDHPPSGRVYTDGSCFSDRHIAVARAGYAICWVDQCGRLEAAVYGSIPAMLPQTAAAGETYAVKRAMDIMDGGQIWTDNQAVVDNLAGTEGGGTSENKVLAGLYLQITSCRRGKPFLVSKVRGHQNIANEQLHTEGWHLAAGNSHADCWAKKGANLRPVEPWHAIADQLAQIAATAVSMGSSVWNSWPSITGVSEMARLVRDAPRTRKNLAHRWRQDQDGGRFRCLACHAQTSRIDTKAATRSCKGSESRKGLWPVLQRGNGHRLVVFYPTGRPPALACTRCGAWAASAPKKLLKPCERREEPRPAMDRLASGRHPGDGTLLEAAFHIAVGLPQGAAVQFRNQ